MKTTSLPVEHYDVVVLGGGMAGVCAALAAARAGAKTVIIQDRPVFGGNSSSEIGVHIVGADELGSHRFSRETGLIDELFADNVRFPNLQGSPSVWSLVLWATLRDQPNLTVHLNAVAYEPQVVENRIKSVTVHQTTTERFWRVTGDVFIDSTGDGRVGYEAGAEYMWGRESRDQFDEPLGQPVADRYTMGNTVYFRARDMGRPVPFVAPPWAHTFESDSSFPGGWKDCPHDIRLLTNPRGGYWWIECGGTLDTVKDAEAIRDQLLCYAVGVWEHIKNRGDHGAENYVLESIGFVPGRRESRRFIGDYIMRQRDVESPQPFPDTIAYGGWHIDMHHPQGIASPDRYWHGALLKRRYAIPFRSLYSHNIDNLMFAGRNVSATHVAMATMRVMATCALMGQAAGYAAYLCRKHDCLPRQIYERHIEELQQALLLQDVYLPGVRERAPNNLARSAKVTASSEKVLRFAEPTEYRPLARPAAQSFFISKPTLTNIQLPLENLTGEQTEVVIRLRSGYEIDDFTSTTDLAVSRATVPPGRHLVDFALSQVNLDVNAPYWIQVDANPSVAWGYSREEVPATQAGVEQDQIFTPPGSQRFIRRIRGCYGMSLTPPSHCFGPAQVLTGVNRPERSSNVWISADPCPQWLRLEWPKPVSIRRIQITFDNDLDRTRTQWSEGGCIPALVRDYRVLACDGPAERVLVEVTDNHQRVRWHDVGHQDVSALRIELLSTWGLNEARVVEVRVF